MYIGLTGAVQLGDNADRVPNFWVWSCGPDIEKYQPFLAISADQVFHLINSIANSSNHFPKNMNNILISVYTVRDIMWMSALPMNSMKCRQVPPTHLHICDLGAVHIYHHFHV